MMGCASAPPPPPSKAAVVFPSPAEIALIPAQEPTITTFDEVDTSTVPWIVRVAPETMPTAYDEATATEWRDFLHDAMKRHPSVSLSASLKCASEELARYRRQGRLGVARCQRRVDLALPRFAFTCKLADSDPYAWVEILGRRPGLVLSRELAAGIATARSDAPIVYKSRSDAEPVVVQTLAELSAAIVDGVNRTRAAAGRSPLMLDTKQSMENTRLAGTLINASFDPTTTDGADAKAVADRAARKARRLPPAFSITDIPEIPEEARSVLKGGKNPYVGFCTLGKMNAGAAYGPGERPREPRRGAQRRRGRR